MVNFATINEFTDGVSVYFNIAADEVMAIGEKMEAINAEAYMNGYNWEAFLNLYLQVNNPDLLKGLETDSEAGTYVAEYSIAESAKAKLLAVLINDLVCSPDKIFSFLQEFGQDIVWD